MKMVKSSRDRRDKVLDVRMSQKEMKVIEACAKFIGMKKRTFARRGIILFCRVVFSVMRKERKDNVYVRRFFAD